MPGRFKPAGWLAAGAIAVLAVLLYLPTVRNGYVFDDTEIVRDNPVIAGQEVGQALAGPYWPVAEGEAANAPNWRPLAMLSMLTERWVAGPGVAALHHAGNAILHGLVVLALYPIALRFAGRWTLAALAIFAAHPAHAESVAPIVGRCDLIAALGALVALECFLRFRDGGSAWWLALGAGAYAVGLGGKESAAPMVLLLPAADLLLRGQGERDGPHSGPYGIVRELVMYLPFAVVAVLYLAARFAVLGGASFQHAMEIDRPMLERLVFAARNAVVSLWLLIVPTRFHHTLTTLPISAPFDYRDPTGVAAAAYAAGGLLLALGWVALCRQAPRAAFLWLGSLVTWLPTSGLFPAGAGVSMRFLLLPTAFYACGLGMALRSAASARPSWGPALAVAAAVFVAIGGALGVRRSLQWHDDGTFYEAILAEAPESYAAHTSLGSWYANRHPPDMDRARAHYRHAIAVAGDSPVGLQSQLDLTTTWPPAEQLMREREVLDHFERLIEAQPGLPGAEKIRVRCAQERRRIGDALPR